MVARSELEAWLSQYLNVPGIQDSLPNGLQIEGEERVKKIVTAVSVSVDVIEHAVREGADTIIVHHGMFWKNDDPTVKGYRRERLARLLKGNINLFAYHLPLDLHPEISHNRLILKYLGASNVEDCSSLHRDYTIGLKGTFPEPLGFQELLERINRALKTRAKAFSYGTDRIRSLFVVSGAGRTMIDKIAALGVDAYLTGDAQEGTDSIAKEERLNYIYAGHYNTEKVGIAELGRKIQGAFPVDVHFFEIPNTL